MSRILVAYDGTLAAEHALRRAVAIHRPGDLVALVAVEAPEAGAVDGFHCAVADLGYPPMAPLARESAEGRPRIPEPALTMS